MLIFGITDINKIAIASFGAMLIVLFNSAYGVMNAKKTRVMAAQIMGVSKWHVFKDVMLMESLPQTFVGLRSAVSMANGSPRFSMHTSSPSRSHASSIGKLFRKSRTVAVFIVGTYYVHSRGSQFPVPNQHMVDSKP